MGNRAIIKGKGQDLGVYVHWNGGIDSVTAFLEYCKLKRYRSPEVDTYGVARLCQVIGNFFGGSGSVGVEKINKNISPEYVSKLWLDNGIYEVENWKIKAHWNPDLVTSERHEGYDLKEMLLKIDGSMPEDEQLGEDFILAEIIDSRSLKLGDKVYLPMFDGRYDVYTVVGIGEEEELCSANVAGLPYVDLYDNRGDYSKNINNYIRDEKIRKVGK